MDITGLTNLATRMSQDRTSEAAALMVLKKAMQMQENTGSALVAMITPASRLPEHLGQNVNVVA
jgi:hypothetical protein